MSKRNTFLFLAAVLIIASFLRLYHLAELPPGLYPDEAMNGNNAIEALGAAPPDGGFKVYYPENNGREGLFINIQAIVLAIFQKAQDPPAGGAPWMLRLPSAIFGILTVLGIYFLGKELFSKREGLFSALLLATSFWHVMFSRIGFRAIMAPLLLVWGMYAFLHAIRKSSEQDRLAVLPSILGGAIYGLGFYTYIAYRVSPLLFLLCIPFFRSSKHFWKISGIFIGAAFIVALPIGMYYASHPADFLGRTSQVSVFSSETPLKDLGMNMLKTAGMFFASGDGNWRHNYAGAPQLFSITALFFALGILHFAMKTFRRRPLLHGRELFAPFLLFAWLGAMALPVVISNEGIPHALRAILMIPPAMLLAGAGAVICFDVLKRHLSRTARYAAAGIVVLILVTQAYRAYFILWGQNENVQGAFSANYVAMAKEINALPESVPKYIVVRAGGVLVNGMPMPTQTVMFLTGTYRTEMQRKKNVFYIFPADADKIPAGAAVFSIE